jgi:hypothetical protein
LNSRDRFSAVGGDGNDDRVHVVAIRLA